jgi:hypothetical protein
MPSSKELLTAGTGVNGVLNRSRSFLKRSQNRIANVGQDGLEFYDVLC